MQMLSYLAGDIIWSQGLHSSDQGWSHGMEFPPIKLLYSWAWFSCQSLAHFIASNIDLKSNWWEDQAMFHLVTSTQRGSKIRSNGQVPTDTWARHGCRRGCWGGGGTMQCLEHLLCLHSSYGMEIKQREAGQPPQWGCESPPPPSHYGHTLGWSQHPGVIDSIHPWDFLMPQGSPAKVDRTVTTWRSHPDGPGNCQQGPSRCKQDTT